MNAFTRFLKWVKWIIRAVVFFVLFAFALNNQQQVTLNLMFGHDWRAPMTLIVLAAFALGLVVGVLGMLPLWWRLRAKTPARTPPAPQDQPATRPAPETAPLDSPDRA